MKDSDPVKSPSHYNQGKYKCPKCDAGIECITIAQEMPYNLGAAVKYIWRHKDKGNPIQDLEKAKQYIQFEIDRITEKGKPNKSATVTPAFQKAADLEYQNKPVPSRTASGDYV